MEINKEITKRIESIIENMESNLKEQYQNLVDDCKKAYREKNIVLANDLWNKLFDLTFDFVDNTDDENKKTERFFIHNYFVDKFTNEEVYAITDYGKRKAYRLEEIARENEIEYISLYDLTKENEMKSLDEFIDFYEWRIQKADEKDKYNIYDIQCKCMVEMNYTLNEVIDRVVKRAIDYYMNEWEFEEEDYNEKFISYLNNFHIVATKYVNNNEKWKQNFADMIKEMR